jgi:hypothetical protein
MPVKIEYQRVAERSIAASEALITEEIQEKAAFMAYHAFESTGCALSDHLGFPVGPRVSHAKKNRHFINAAKRLRNERAVAALAVTLSSIRNDLLYPVENPSTGEVQLPEKTISLSQSKELKKRVKGIVKWVLRQL